MSSCETRDKPEPHRSDHILQKYCDDDTGDNDDDDDTVNMMMTMIKMTVTGDDCTLHRVCQ